MGNPRGGKQPLAPDALASGGGGGGGEGGVARGWLSPRRLSTGRGAVLAVVAGLRSAGAPTSGAALAALANAERGGDCA
jgi:hypothetical protein